MFVRRTVFVASLLIGALALGAALAQPAKKPPAQQPPKGPAAPGAGHPPEAPPQASPEAQAEMMKAMKAKSPEQQWMLRQCGTFKVKMTMTLEPGAEPLPPLQATSTREMILGGRFLMERTESGKDSPLAFSTMSIYGFNADAEGGPRFEIVRYSSMAPCTMPEEGRWDEASKTLTSVGMHQLAGMTERCRVVHRFENDDKGVAEIYFTMEGYGERFKGVKVPEYKGLVMEYERVK